MLRGRDDECKRIEDLLDRARGGQGATLVLRGEAGIGKTALLELAKERATGFRLAHAWGVHSEMELVFAGLHQLCAPMLDPLDRLPESQRDALGTAFGLTAGAPPDPALVGLAALGLLAEVAADQPLACLIDDVQWLDRASLEALAFAARRLRAEAVAIVFATRAPMDELAGLPELVLGGLGDDDARALLGAAIEGPLDERVCDRIVAETRGNPLALLELPRGLTPAQLAGGFGLAGPVSSGIEESFQRRIEELPATSRMLLLVAAAEPLGDPALVWRAAEGLGIGPDAAGPLAAAGLAELSAEVGFRHPLVRSTAYATASAQERQRVHGALADATDAAADPDRRAWHRAQAAAGPDEAVAAELERSAGRAKARGGVAAAAAFLERSLALTPDPARRAQRALTAAEAKHQAGAPDAAVELLGVARAGPLDELDRARADLLRGQVAFAVRRGGNAAALLLDAARRLEPLDPTLARETHLDAFSAAVYAGRLANGPDVVDVARAVRAVPPVPRPSAQQLVLDGLALVVTEGYVAAAPTLQRAVAAFRREEASPEEELRWLGLAGHAAMMLWDLEAWDELSARLVARARGGGALAALPIAINARIGVHLNAGEYAAAASLVEELDAITEATGNQIARYGAVSLAALHGDEAEMRALVDATTEAVTARGEGMALTFMEWSSAVLYNGLGRYDDALAVARRADERAEDLWTTLWLHELVEAAARTGETTQAADAARRLSEMARASGTAWALALAARSHALVSEGDDAEGLYRETIERLAGTRLRVALARSHLVYGEWLRRRRRRGDAREQLRTAHELLATIGVGAFAQRAKRELEATGATARKRTAEASGQLTAQEAQIARLARDGLSNPEIGARLFLSPRTVQYHLRTVFAKLDISSRNQLERVLA